MSSNPESLSESLRHIHTIAELEDALGELTPEEKALVAAMEASPPTEEEIAEFQRQHPDFTQHLLDLVRQRLDRS